MKKFIDYKKYSLYHIVMDRKRQEHKLRNRSIIKKFVPIITFVIVIIVVRDTVLLQLSGNNYKKGTTHLIKANSLVFTDRDQALIEKGKALAYEEIGIRLEHRTMYHKLTEK